MVSSPFKLPAIAALTGAFGLTLMACTPTLKVKVELAPIYAKLDVNVRVQLDKEVKDLANKNPDLF
jgi:hypothetical protein